MAPWGRKRIEKEWFLKPFQVPCGFSKLLAFPGQKVGEMMNLFTKASESFSRFRMFSK